MPEVLAAWEEDGDPFLVERFIAGVPLDLRAGRQGAVRPWEVVGRIAALVHRSPLAAEEPASRRASTFVELDTLDAVDPDLAEPARAWAMAHLPPDEPATLLHVTCSARTSSSRWRA